MLVRNITIVINPFLGPIINKLHSFKFISLGADAKDLLSYRQTKKKKNEQNIEDVLDGKLYKGHFDDDGYFKGTEERKNKRVNFTSHSK